MLLKEIGAVVDLRTVSNVIAKNVVIHLLLKTAIVLPNNTETGPNSRAWRPRRMSSRRLVRAFSNDDKGIWRLTGQP